MMDILKIKKMHKKNLEQLKKKLKIENYKKV